MNDEQVTYLSLSMRAIAESIEVAGETIKQSIDRLPDLSEQINNLTHEIYMFRQIVNANRETYLQEMQEMKDAKK